VAYPLPTLETNNQQQSHRTLHRSLAWISAKRQAPLARHLRQLRKHTHIIPAAAKGKSKTAMQRAWYISIDEKGVS
jgi:hypothetical protein